MRVRIKQSMDGSYWDIEYKKWFHPWWQYYEYYGSQEIALNVAKTLQSPVIIEIMPSKKRSTTYTHYTTGE